MGVAAFAVPFLIEAFHIAPSFLPGLEFQSGGAFIPPGVADLPRVPFQVLAFAATLGSIFTPMLTVFPVLDAGAALRVDSFLRAWHLRQLAPAEREKKPSACSDA